MVWGGVMKAGFTTDGADDADGETGVIQKLLTSFPRR